MRGGFQRVGVLVAIAACGEVLPASESTDGGPLDGDAGTDSSMADDAAGDVETIVANVVEPWRVALAGGDVVVTSHAAGSGGGVFRAPKTGGAALRVGFRPAWGIAVRASDDVWFCNAGDAGGPGLVRIPGDGGPNEERTSDLCRDVAVEPNG